MAQVPDARFDALESGDIRRRRLTGRPAEGQAFRHNIVESRLEDIEFVSIDFARCDWKDCRIDRATFYDCDLGHASMITDAFAECRFVRCRFPETGISDCSFTGCAFEDCDFTSIIVKSSRFEECRFARCATSNRIIESSLLLHTDWSEMELALALVTGNFGLRQSELHQCRLVSRVGSDDLEMSEATAVATIELSPIERFRLAYFWSGQVDADAEALEAALDLRNWSGDAVVQASFGAQLSSFSQFLLAVYGFDETPIYPLLVLHSRNFAFLEWLSARVELLPLYQVVAGVHLTLTREVDAFVAQLSRLVALLGNQRAVHFAAEGPLDAAYFARWFADQALDGVEVVSVRPRNSPVDLAVMFHDNRALFGAIALFLACRTRFELMKLGAASGSEPVPPDAAGRSLVTFSAGFSKASPVAYEINVQTLLPRSLLLDLNLSISIVAFKRARAVLVGLLMPGLGDAVLPHTPDPAAGRSRRRSPPA